MTMSCRGCGSSRLHSFCDLGLSPISNAFIKPEDLSRGEQFYPLHAQVCEACWLVQLDQAQSSDLHFHDDYVYFSSYSDGWLLHAKHYVSAMVSRFALTGKNRVMEIASNDGYLLQNFVALGIPCIGVEPTANTAAAARRKGIETREVFFGRDTASQLASDGWRVDLVAGNNVLAHVPDIHDFVAGLPIVLNAEGVVTFEFPHLLKLIEHNQFDTIYHEHYSYLSLTALGPIFTRAGLRVFDVEAIPTHGGSLRVFLCHEQASHAEQSAVAEMHRCEEAAGLKSIDTYRAFAERVRETKRALLSFLIDAKRRGKRVAAYGAAAKGNTLLNYCGVGMDFIDVVADKNPAKQGRYLPGSRIPVVAPEALIAAEPDYVLILPWNLREEVAHQLSAIRKTGGQFVVPIPRVEIF